MRRITTCRQPTSGTEFRWRRAVWPLLACMMVTLACGGPPAGAQLPAAAPAAEAVPSDGDVSDAGGGPVEAAGETVDVDPTADDGAIDRRITDILEATGRYTVVDVSVRNGVVFLRGATDRGEYRDLAGELSRKVSDVVAVVNQIEVDRGPWWDLTPAWDELHGLTRDAVQMLPLLLLAALLLGVTFAASGPLSRLLVRPLHRVTDSELVRNVLRKVIVLLLLVAGVYLFLRVSGLTRIALTLISGTGLVGLILGFAFRDIAENFLASLLISIQKPFRLGDVVEVDGHTGLVQAVTTRGTLLVDFDGNHIQIANSTVYKNTIKNFTANPKLRLTFAVGIGYDASIGTAQSTVMQTLADHSAVLKDPAPQVLVDSLGSSTINLTVYYWIDGHDYSGLKVNSAVMRRAVRALEAAGVSMPDDAREVVFPSGVPVRMLDAAAALSGSPSPSDEHPSAATASGARGDDESPAHAAEGGLENEAKELQRQGDAARRPDEGASVL